jgi:hypothetical protein
MQQSYDTVIMGPSLGRTEPGPGLPSILRSLSSFVVSSADRWSASSSSSGSKGWSLFDSLLVLGRDASDLTDCERCTDCERRPVPVLRGSIVGLRDKLIVQSRGSRVGLRDRPTVQSLRGSIVGLRDRPTARSSVGFNSHCWQWHFHARDCETHMGGIPLVTSPSSSLPSRRLSRESPARLPPWALSTGSPPLELSRRSPSDRRPMVVLLALREGMRLPKGEYKLWSLRRRQAFWKLKASSVSLCFGSTGRRYLSGGIFSPGW